MKRFIIVLLALFVPMATATALQKVVNAFPDTAFLVVFILFLTIIGYLITKELTAK